MSVLNYLISAKVDASEDEIDGKILSRPRLTISDGTNLTYAADVSIGRTGIDPITGAVVEKPIRNVPIAHGNNKLLYADAGQAVRLRRSKSGRWEIVGFSKRLPGTYKRYGVALPNYCLANPQYTLDPVLDVGLESRPITYDELATLGGGYGIALYGAIALYRGGVFLEFI